MATRSARAATEAALSSMPAATTSDLLERAVEEAARLLDADGAMIYILDPAGDTLRFAHESGIADARRRRWVRRLHLRVGEGMFGVAVAERRVVVTHDYPNDDAFAHSPDADRFVTEVGLRSMVVAPLLAGDRVFGGLGTFSTRPNAFGEAQVGLVRALADHAAGAMANALLIEELARSRAEIARRAEAERTVREIAGRIAELRDPDELLLRIVEDARRLLGSDGAHMTRMADDGSGLIPQVVSGGLDEVTGSWLKRQRLPLMAGINGLAAAQGQPVWTEDYLTDERIPHDRNDDTAHRLGLRGMASVPLRSTEGRVIGTLAVSYLAPHVFDEDDLAVLKALGDHAAIALTNTTLYQRLSESEAAYRHLVQNSPDLVWSVGPDACFTFVSDTCERLTGWRPAGLLGRHFGALVHPSSRDVAEFDWTAGVTQPHQQLRGRLNLLHRDGHAIPAEFSAMSELDGEGRFIGANGSVRDMTDQDRLERELRDSEERYRFLVQNAPDVVFSIDAEGRFTYLSETMERLTGFLPSELVGQHFATVVDEATLHEASAKWAALAADPDTPQVASIRLIRKDGGPLVPVEVSSIGMKGPDGQFAGIHGATRDMTERETLERDLRRQAAELAAGEERAHLARELHDSVTQALFSMTLLTRTTEMLLERDPKAARDRLADLRDLQREALAEMRALIFELRPGNLEQDGLIRALRTHSAALQGRIGLAIVVRSDLDRRLPIEIEEVLYRIAQEALHNVVKHAGARQASVDVEPGDGIVRMRIVDDGRGFEPGQAGDGHLGLAGMRARADKVGATLAVRSQPGSGTTIEVVVPLPATAEPSAATTAGAPIEASPGAAAEAATAPATAE